LIRCVCGKKIGPDPRNFNQRVSLGRNDLLIRTFPSRKGQPNKSEKGGKKALEPLLQENPGCSIEYEHGHIEARKCYVIPAQELAAHYPDWQGLQTLGIAIGYRIDSVGGKSR
ncbi:hypothetical protein ACUNHP_17715, partial [Serratia sp. IR-2025]